MIKSLGDVGHSFNVVKEKLLTTVIANWKFWIFGLTMIYGFVPFVYRAIGDVVLGTVWGCIFTFIFHNK